MLESQSKTHEVISVWQWTQAHVLVTSTNSSSHLGTSSFIFHTFATPPPRIGWWLQMAPVLLCPAAPLPAADSQQGSIPSLLLLANKDHRLAQVCRGLLTSPGPISPAQKRPPGAGCPGPWWDGFWIFSGMETPPVWGISIREEHVSFATPLPVFIFQGKLRQASKCLLCCLNVETFLEEFTSENSCSSIEHRNPGLH